MDELTITQTTYGACDVYIFTHKGRHYEVFVGMDSVAVWTKNEAEKKEPILETFKDLVEMSKRSKVLRDLAVLILAE